VLVVRGGAIQDRRDFFFEKAQELDGARFLEAFLPQFYDANPFLPAEIHLPVAVASPGLLEEFLAARRGARVGVKVPQRGPAAERVRLAERNAGERHRVRFRRTGGDEALAVERLSRAIGLAIPPHRIEAFDISHLQGTDSVASMVVFEDGKPKKSDYRLFNVASQELLAPDDFKSMAEVVERRYRRVQEKDGPWPDLVLVDGGRGQLQAALTALDRLGIELPTVGLAKREEEIWVPIGRSRSVSLPRKDAALQWIQRVRDEAHRFAISRHRQRRGSACGERG
jgi:excinuclease ABC subunit C